MTLRRRRIPSPHGGSDYVVGGYVAFKEEHPSTDEWGGTRRDVTWGVVTLEDYERRGGDVGLDAEYECGTLRAAHDWVESQASSDTLSSLHTDEGTER